MISNFITTYAMSKSFSMNNFVVIIGNVRILMNIINTAGNLMADAGLADFLCFVFAWLKKMFIGKKCP